ncbi:MAG: DoxX family protein [Bacteroides sp.]|nr:DoxX family protein [Bacteroides sp.]
METDKKHIVKEVWVNACRFLLAAVFIFSGFVKAVDPLGSFYKIQDYLTAFGLISHFPSLLIMFLAIMLSVAEFCVGIYMFFGIRRKIASTLALLLLVVMTPLTLYLALANPVSDCGCFGDAWVLTNWQTFAKNVVLLVAAVVVFRFREQLIRFITLQMEWLVSLYTLFFVCVLSLYCLENLPILDFRPYKIGTNIKQAMEVPEGAKQSVFETTFVMEKDGRRQEFALEDYPDSTWTFVETRTLLKEKGYEPPIHDFSMVSLESGEDITDSVLTAEGYTFLLVAHRIEAADDSNIDLINEIYDYSVEHGYGFLALTSSSEKEIDLWRDKTGAEYPFCQMDDITLKTVIRSNPGLLLIKAGTILNKWSDSQLPDEYVLTAGLDKLELGQLKHVSKWETVGNTLLWFFLPLTLVIGIDIFVIKRREKLGGKIKQAPRTAKPVVPQEPQAKKP